MRRVVHLFLVVGTMSCATPPVARHSGIGSGVECSIPGGFVTYWQLLPMAEDVTGLTAELTLESSHPHEKWRPLVFVMLDSGDESDSVQVRIWEPKGSRDLELEARVIEGSVTTSSEPLASHVAKGETRSVGVDWSRPGQLDVRVGEKTASVPLHFPVTRILAGCSGADGRVWVPEG